MPRNDYLSVQTDLFTKGITPASQVVVAKDTRSREIVQIVDAPTTPQASILFFRRKTEPAPQPAKPTKWAYIAKKVDSMITEELKVLPAIGSEIKSPKEIDQFFTNVTHIQTQLIDTIKSEASPHQISALRSFFNYSLQFWPNAKLVLDKTLSRVEKHEGNWEDVERALNRGALVDFVDNHWEWAHPRLPKDLTKMGKQAAIDILFEKDEGKRFIRAIEKEFPSVVDTYVRFIDKDELTSYLNKLGGTQNRSISKKIAVDPRVFQPLESNQSLLIRSEYRPQVEVTEDIVEAAKNAMDTIEQLVELMERNLIQTDDPLALFHNIIKLKKLGKLDIPQNLFNKLAERLIALESKRAADIFGGAIGTLCSAEERKGEWLINFKKQLNIDGRIGTIEQILKELAFNPSYIGNFVQKAKTEVDTLGYQATAHYIYKTVDDSIKSLREQSFKWVFETKNLTPAAKIEILDKMEEADRLSFVKSLDPRATYALLDGIPPVDRTRLFSSSLEDLENKAQPDTSTSSTARGRFHLNLGELRGRFIQQLNITKEQITGSSSNQLKFGEGDNAVYIHPKLLGKIESYLLTDLYRNQDREAIMFLSDYLGGGEQDHRSINERLAQLETEFTLTYDILERHETERLTQEAQAAFATQRFNSENAKPIEKIFAIKDFIQPLIANYLRIVEMRVKLDEYDDNIREELRYEDLSKLEAKLQELLAKIFEKLDEVEPNFSNLLYKNAKLAMYNGSPTSLVGAEAATGLRTEYEKAEQTLRTGIEEQGDAIYKTALEEVTKTEFEKYSLQDELTEQVNHELSWENFAAVALNDEIFIEWLKDIPQEAKAFLRILASRIQANPDSTDGIKEPYISHLKKYNVVDAVILARAKEHVREEKLTEATWDHFVRAVNNDDKFTAIFETLSKDAFLKTLRSNIQADPTDAEKFKSTYNSRIEKWLEQEAGAELAKESLYTATRKEVLAELSLERFIAAIENTEDASANEEFIQNFSGETKLAFLNIKNHNHQNLEDAFNEFVDLVIFEKIKSTVAHTHQAEIDQKMKEIDPNRAKLEKYEIEKQGKLYYLVSETTSDGVDVEEKYDQLGNAIIDALAENPGLIRSTLKTLQDHGTNAYNTLISEQKLVDWNVTMDMIFNNSGMPGVDMNIINPFNAASQILAGRIKMPYQELVEKFIDREDLTRKEVAEKAFTTIFVTMGQENEQVARTVALTSHIEREQSMWSKVTSWFSWIWS